MKIIIDQQPIDVKLGTTILEAARKAGIHIPTLCYHEAFAGQGMCRMCMVEVKTAGTKRMVAACTYAIYHEIEVVTSTPAIEKMRRNIVSLLYRSAPDSELMKKLYKDYGCEQNRLSINQNESCILCRLCVKACEEMGSSAISAVFRGTEKRVGTPFDEASEACIGCAACARICPTEAIPISETDNERTIWNKKFSMVKCESCGRPFATREQIDYIISRTGVEGFESKLCEGCRKKNLAAQIKEFSE